MNVHALTKSCLIALMLAACAPEETNSPGDTNIDPKNDNNTTQLCGNATQDDGERCDTKAPAGSSFACPTACDDDKVCTRDVLVDEGTCDAYCDYPDITACDGDGGDGCCPDGCDASNDTDCEPLDSVAFPVSVSAGANHSCTILSDGRVSCWGETTPTSYGSAPRTIDSLQGPVSAIAVGEYHSCALLSDARVQCWGSNEHGQLGRPPFATEDQMLVPLASEAVAVSCGDSHSCALLATGAVQCWGADDYGQLGYRTEDLADWQPRFVSDLVQCGADGPCPNDGDRASADQDEPGLVTAIAAGPAHTCALTNENKVFCWGQSLVDDSDETGGPVTNMTPVEVFSFPSATSALSSGRHHICGPLASGQVACWGSSESGQLGHTRHEGALAQVVNGLEGVIEVVAGGDHTCAAQSTGRLTCWGSDSYGQLGDGGANAIRTEPVEVFAQAVTAVAAGREHTCAIVDESIVCWGSNSDQQINTASQSEHRSATAPVSLSSAERATSVASGFAHSCALTNTGKVICWGQGTSGQLGNGQFYQQPIPVEVVGLTSVTKVAAGGTFSCALTNTGSVFCWGENWRGVLGEGPDSPTPVQVVAAGASDVVAGGAHACALIDGGAKCWGGNERYQVGGGSPEDAQPVPVDVVGLTEGVVQLTAGNKHTCALLATGAVKCWGDDSSGQVGTGGTDYFLETAPVDVVGLMDVTAIDAGESHTCALREDGGVSCWGSGWFGQLGNGFFIELEDGQRHPGQDSRHSSPVEVIGLDDTVTAITSGSTASCALLQSGRIMCWGVDWHGQLGDGGSGWDPHAIQARPILVNGIDSAISVSIGGNHACAVLASGETTCWGSNFYGELGKDTIWGFGHSTVPRSAMSGIVLVAPEVSFCTNDPEAYEASGSPTGEILPCPDLGFEN